MSTNEEKDQLWLMRHNTGRCGGIKNDCIICNKLLIKEHLTESMNKVFEEIKINEREKKTL